MFRASRGCHDQNYGIECVRESWVIVWSDKWIAFLGTTAKHTFQSDDESINYLLIIIIEYNIYIYILKPLD